MFPDEHRVANERVDIHGVEERELADIDGHATGHEGVLTHVPPKYGREEPADEHLLKHVGC